MQELEKLLNSLIQRGWRPWGKYDKILNVSKYNGWLMRLVQSNDAWMYVHIRSIVSLESGLWQFVCENDMVYSSSFIEWQKWGKQWVVLGLWSVWHKYRLLESALIPEEELGKFLVDNIRINESLWTAD